jgi:nicotinamidase-related amidase
MKGQNCLTEMYSAIKADYQMLNDPKTQPDALLRAELENTDKVQMKCLASYFFNAFVQLLVCGQALSHCVNSTFTDILSTYPAIQRKNLVLLTDGTVFSSEYSSKFVDLELRRCFVCSWL